MSKWVVPFFCTITKLRLNITNVNHEAMHTTKQFFPMNYHATNIEFTDFILIQSYHDMGWVYF